MGLDITDESIGALEEVESFDVGNIDVQFISKLSRDVSRCLLEGSKPFSIRSDENYEICFSRPIYVSDVVVWFSKGFAGSTLELSVFDALSNKDVKKRIKKDSFSDNFLFDVGLVSSGFSILLPPYFFELFGKKTLSITKIEVLGFLEEDFVKISDSLTEVQGLRDRSLEEINEEKIKLINRQERLQQRENIVSQMEENKRSELVGLDEEIENKSEELDDINSDIQLIKQEIVTSSERRKDISDQISRQKTILREIEGEISKKEDNLRAVGAETSEAERRLKSLTNNVNLFSEEFSSFSDNGAKQARVFIGLSFVPLLVVVFLTTQLLIGAVDLSVKYVKEPDLDLMTVFVTRLPYLVICSSILAVCYSVLRFLINRVSVIYAERLDFAKVGILAKDIASASASGLDFNDEQIYEARTYLKIEMLKSYLGGCIGEFSYRKRAVELSVGNLQEEKVKSETVDNDEKRLDE